jgi:hypothetical protein
MGGMILFPLIKRHDDPPSWHDPGENAIARSRRDDDKIVRRLSVIENVHDDGDGGGGGGLAA